MVAAQIIYAVLYKQQTVDSLLLSARAKVAKKDQALLTHLVQGALRWYLALKKAADVHITTQIRQSDQIIYVLIALGLYQRFIMKQPDYVSVHTVVEACKGLGKQKTAGLVNAVLRKTIKSIEEKQFEWVEGESTHPDWLVELIQEAANSDELTADILRANDQYPPVWLRINPHKQQITYDKLTAAGATLCRSDEVPSAFLSDNSFPVEKLLDIGGEDTAVQDVSAQYLGVILAQYAEQLPEKAVVVDACAAPGGKTALMAQQFPSWDITAVDKSTHRLERLHENLARQNLRVSVQQADLLDQAHEFFCHEHDVDLVVLDAPCSGIGVIRRHPDIKHLRAPQAIARVAKQQEIILNNVWSRVKPGGLLIYITCSYLTAETDHVIDDFCRHASDVEGAAPLMKRKIFPSTQARLVDPENQMENDKAGFPKALMDGFFYAVLRKTL